MIRLCCFCDTVDDRAGLCAVDTVDQLPRMFVQTEAAQCTFRFFAIKRKLDGSGGVATYYIAKVGSLAGLEKREIIHFG